MAKRRLNDTEALTRSARPKVSDALSGTRTNTVEIRPISNGYIRSERSYEPGKGCSHVETFHASEPEMYPGKAPPQANSLSGAKAFLNRK